MPGFQLTPWDVKNAIRAFLKGEKSLENGLLFGKQ